MYVTMWSATISSPVAHRQKSCMVCTHHRIIRYPPPPFFLFACYCLCQVYKAVKRATKEPVAIKVMTKARLGERALHMLAAEINILRTLEHRESHYLYTKYIYFLRDSCLFLLYTDCGCCSSFSKVIEMNFLEIFTLYHYV